MIFLSVVVILIGLVIVIWLAYQITKFLDYLGIEDNLSLTYGICAILYVALILQFFVSYYVHYFNCK